MCHAGSVACRWAIVKKALELRNVLSGRLVLERCVHVLGHGGRAEMNQTRPPLFCDNCSSFSFAELDGAFLCADCLLAAIATETEPGLKRLRIVPIEFTPIGPLESPGG
jgi:hypothetical protein